MSTDSTGSPDAISPTAVQNKRDTRLRGLWSRSLVAPHARSPNFDVHAAFQLFRTQNEIITSTLWKAGNFQRGLKFGHGVCGLEGRARG